MVRDHYHDEYGGELADEGWRYVPVAIGFKEYAECYNECVAATIERQDFLEDFGEGPFTAPDFVTEFANLAPGEQPKYIAATDINGLRDKIEELVPYFKNPSTMNSSGEWSAYANVTAILGHDWTHVPPRTQDDSDPFSDAYVYGYRATTTTPSTGDVTTDKDDRGRHWVEHLNEMRTVLNALVWYVRDATYIGGSIKSGDSVTGSPAAMLAEAYAEQQADEASLAGIKQGAAASVSMSAAAHQGQREFFSITWPTNFAIKRIRPAASVISYYTNPANTKLTPYTANLGWQSGAGPDPYQAAAYNWGAGMQGGSSIDGVYDGDYRDLGEFYYVAGGLISAHTDNKVYVSVRPKETELVEVLNYPDPGSHAYSAFDLRATDGTGPHVLCRVAFEYDGDTPEAPDETDVDFTGTPLSGTAPLTVAFTAQCTGVIYAYRWTFGDGSAYGYAKNPTHTYSGAGTYTVSLEVKGPGGQAVETKSGYITVT